MFRRATVYVVVLATLFLCLSALGHTHSNTAARTCDVCHVLDAPVVLAQSTDSAAPQAHVDWHAAPEHVHPELDPVLASSSPRAPPV